MEFHPPRHAVALQAAIPVARSTTGVSTGVIVDVTSARLMANSHQAPGAIYGADFAQGNWTIGAATHAAAVEASGKGYVACAVGVVPVTFFASQADDDAGLAASRA